VFSAPEAEGGELVKLWKEGDRSRAVCERCQRLVETRFERRTVRLERPPVEVPAVLVAVCTICGETVAIPAQSAPRLQEARRSEAVRFEVRIPLELDDALRLIASKYTARPEAFEGSLIRYYLAKLGEDETTARRIKEMAASPLASGRNTGRISLRIEKPTWERAWKMARRVGIKNKSETIRGIIVAAAVDSGVANEAEWRSSLEFKKALRTIALATSFT
jgi:hypothetical protein